MNKLRQALSDSAAAVDALLDSLLPPAAGPRGRVIKAMRYATLGGGKRLRPHLVQASAALFEVPHQYALRTAAAIEMIHCYSLIHDDLPAMDDSDLRRGRPTVHKEFDEATAILAGDGLLPEAFVVLADPATHPDSQVRCELITGLAQASGAGGMVGGQMIDISPQRDGLDIDGVIELQRLKTGALFTFSCESGATLGRANRSEREALCGYAKNLGLAFQIVDDLLDSESTAESLGKPTGQDEAANKATLPGLLGVEKARNMARELIEEACDRLDIFAKRSELLCDTARFVIERRS